ncbi:hypothetical protein Tco_0486523 [Tanacetum coccineum]
MPSTHDWPMIGLGIASVAPKGVIACVSFLILELGECLEFFVWLPGVDPSHSPDLTSAFFGVRDDSDGQIKQNLSVTPLGAATYSFSLCCSIGYCSVEESKAEDEANVEDTAYPGKEDGLDSLSFMAWAKAALMTFSEDMLIRRSQSQSLCSPLSVMWVRNPNQKSSASQWLNGSHHPPLAQTPFAALITRSRGTLLGGLHDDSQSEVFYYAIFISSKTGLGGWSQWSMKIPRRVVLSLASGITLNGIDRSSLPSSTSSGVKPAKKAFSILSEPFVCAYWKIWATSSLSDLIQIISQSGLLDSEWVREVLGLSPNVGLEALAESLNIPEGSQDKDSLKVLTELPRSTAALPRHGKGSWDEEKKEKVQGEMSSKELVKTRFFSTGHGVKLEGSMNYAKGKSWALLLSIYKWSRQRAPLEQKAASCKHYSKSSELRNKSEASRGRIQQDCRHEMPNADHAWCQDTRGSTSDSA